MEIIPIGCGSASSVKEPQTNFLITHNGKNLLIDCGSRVPIGLDAMGLKYLDINAIYISHLHADHSGGLEDFAFTSYFTPGYRRAIKIFGNKGLLHRGWDHTWSGGLCSIQGETTMYLDSYFDVTYVEENSSFIWEGIVFDLIQSIHIMDKFSLVPSYGLLIKDPNSLTKIYITTDTQHCPSQLKDFYNLSDIIIQDCETSKFASGVHAHISELKGLPAEIKAKMYLTHYGDNFVIDFEASENMIKEAGFRGLCKKQVPIKF